MACSSTRPEIIQVYDILHRPRPRLVAEFRNPGPRDDLFLLLTTIATQELVVIAKQSKRAFVIGTLVLEDDRESAAVS